MTLPTFGKVCIALLVCITAVMAASIPLTRPRFEGPEYPAQQIVGASLLPYDELHWGPAPDYEEARPIFVDALVPLRDWDFYGGNSCTDVQECDGVCPYELTTQCHSD